MISTHVLDTALGQPAKGISVRLEYSESGVWKEIGQGLTDLNGRVSELLNPAFSLTTGEYRMTFELKNYFVLQNRKSFYPYVSLVFEIDNPKQKFHVPLLLSDYGYSTYRGS